MFSKLSVFILKLYETSAGLLFLLTYPKISPSVQALNMMEWVWLWVNSIHQPSVLLNCLGWWIIHDMCYTFFLQLLDLCRFRMVIDWEIMMRLPERDSGAFPLKWLMLLLSLPIYVTNFLSFHRRMAVKVKSATVCDADFVVQCGFRTCMRTVEDANWNPAICECVKRAGGVMEDPITFMLIS